MDDVTSSPVVVHRCFLVLGMDMFTKVVFIAKKLSDSCIGTFRAADVRWFDGFDNWLNDQVVLILYFKKSSVC
jgi:hypothetical protein